MTELPGLAGELMADYFCKLPTRIDQGLAVGGVLDVMMACARRCQIRAPSLSPENQGVEVWNPIDVWIGLIGSRRHMQAVIRGANILLDTVDRGLWSGMVGWLPPVVGTTGDRLLVLANGAMTGSGFPRAKPSPELVAHLQAIADRNGFIARMNPSAWEYGWENVRQWAKECAEKGDLNPMTGRIRRWTSVAALLAVGVNPDRPTITADMLVTARKIAIFDHDATWKALSEFRDGPPLH